MDGKKDLTNLVINLQGERENPFPFFFDSWREFDRIQYIPMFIASGEVF
jgi:hypothetical protein